MYEAANALRRNVALFCRRIATFLEMHSDSTLVRVIMDESAVTLHFTRCLMHAVTIPFFSSIWRWHEPSESSHNAPQWHWCCTEWHQLVRWLCIRMLCQLTLTVTNERLLDVCIINYYRDALINQVHGEVAQTVLFPPPPFSPTLTITQVWHSTIRFSSCPVLCVFHLRRCVLHSFLDFDF